uniref:Cilia-and flagella-associated protein 96 n=1 Tax=Haptolina ericina TaxID=156174 RepID=A0A7S3BTE4_9EUKA
MQCTMQSFGTFSTPSFAGVGEPFIDTLSGDSRTKGRQFSTNKQRKGQTGDNWNRGPGRRQLFQVLFEGEKYLDPHTFERKWQLEESKRNLTSDGFRFSRPNQKSAGLGNYWGCIGPKFKHMQDFEVLGKEDKPVEVKHELRQVITNPPKKGYGASTPGVIFGPGARMGEAPKQARWGGPEYEHSTDPYDAARQYEKRERMLNEEASLGRPPFRTVSHAVDFFDAKKGVASSAVFTEEPRVPDRDPKDSGSEFKPVGGPFYPSKAPRSGKQGTFTKFPEYLPDPLEEKLKAAKEAAQAARASIGGPFKPPQKPKTCPTKTIIFHQPGPQLA